MTRHLATLRAFFGLLPFGITTDYILSSLGPLPPRGEVSRPRTHCHLVVELHPYPVMHHLLRRGGRDVGLGCGLSIVASSTLLPYPRSLPWCCTTPFGGPR